MRGSLCRRQVQLEQLHAVPCCRCLRYPKHLGDVGASRRSLHIQAATSAEGDTSAALVWVTQRDVAGVPRPKAVWGPKEMTDWAEAEIRASGRARGLGPCFGFP
jgi:hypothetical protein